MKKLQMAVNTRDKTIRLNTVEETPLSAEIPINRAATARSINASGTAAAAMSLRCRSGSVEETNGPTVASAVPR